MSEVDSKRFTDAVAVLEIDDASKLFFLRCCFTFRWLPASFGARL